jgi:hypothetical protein
MRRRWRYPLALLLISAPLLVFVPAASADPVTWSCNGGGCSSDWYRGDVTVAFFVAPDSTIIGTPGCGVFQVTSDTTGQSFQCVVKYNTGGSYGTPVIAVKRDATPPTVNAGAPSRGADANGWYNHPVDIQFSGSDATSGLASCTSVSYGGPDTAGTSVSGSCRDQAGNVSGTVSSQSFKYDATPPKLTNVGTDWDDGTATLTWTASPDTKEVDIDRSPGVDGAATSTVYKGFSARFQDTGLQNKVKYTYTITGLDEAGNKAVDTVSIIPSAKLYSPARGTSVASSPLLAWRAFPSATYYNVQLYYGVRSAFRRVASVDVSGRKVLSVWPVKPKYRLKKTWTYKKKKRALSRGHYRWYVYPGLGKRSANKYGPLIGSSDFFFVKKG